MGIEKEISTYFIPATRTYLDGLVRGREGEVKLGERVLTGNIEMLAECTAKYVLIGVPEDIGVRANYGVGGAHTLWEPALRALLNIQNTKQTRGENLLILGAFDFANWMLESENMNNGELRRLVENIDEEVSQVIKKVMEAGKIPIVIGGGHNNAYPLLKASSLAKGGSVNCINLDAHSDYRRLEGRHSGNGFRYAREHGFLDKYAMIGLHRAYNSAVIAQEISSLKALHASYYEDIFLKEKQTFKEAISDAVNHTKGKSTGIELDLDCIEKVLSSAMTPCGLSTLQARQYIHTCLQNADVAYVHICEGATKLRDGREDTGVAKLIAYLISDILALEV